MNIKQITNYNRPDPEHPENPIPLGNVSKFSFCCEPKGIGQSIIITNQGETAIQQTIVIGKTGMIEYQEEHFKDANDPDAETKVITPNITSVTIPSGFK